MKHYFAVFVVVVANGCTTSGTEFLSRSDSVKSTTTQPSEFDAAIETIATSDDMGAVHAADATLRSGGQPAITALRKHLSDNRIPPSNYLTRSVTGTPDMSDHCFWLIQDMIEPPIPKLYAGLYSVLTPDTVEGWLDERQGKSIVELQVDAATTSLERAKRDFDLNGESHAQEAIRIYNERLTKLRTKTR